MEYYMSRCWLNKVCVSCGLKAQKYLAQGNCGRAESPKVLSPGQAKRRPGFGMRAICVATFACPNPLFYDVASYRRLTFGFFKSDFFQVGY